MIQTQLLRLDPPYQIISARGYVGIQVATLIVTEVVEPSRNRQIVFGRHHIEYHSYPVVNYGLKQGLDEQLKYNNGYPDDFEEYKIRRRMQPEGAVWSGVDIKDVRVLGLAGANNRAIELEYFVYLIPTVLRHDPSLHVWDKNSTSRIYDFYNGLGNVGLKTQALIPETYRAIDGKELDERNEFGIVLSLEHNVVNTGYCIKVLVRENRNGPYEPDNSIYFRCLINPEYEESVNECAATVAEGLYGLSRFLPTQKLKLMSKNDLIDSEDPNTGFMAQLITNINNNYKALLYPHYD